MKSRKFHLRFAPILAWLACFAAVSALADQDGEFIAGPAFSSVKMTLDDGRYEDVGGPFFYSQLIDTQRQWAFVPLFCNTRTPEVDWEEWEFVYPLLDYRRFGPEYRLELCELLSFYGGRDQAADHIERFTVFPFYFQQLSSDSRLDYMAVVPFYGHLVNRLFHDDIRFIMFPLYAETRNKDMITDNYLYPIFNRVRGGSAKGWQVWPLVGETRRSVTLQTNNMGYVMTNGGYDRLFVLWPFYSKDRSGLGTTNPAASLTLIPFFSQTRSPSRDSTSYGWPFGYNVVNDRENQYVEHDIIWPLFVRAHGSKTLTRYFPFYSEARNADLESRFYLWPLYLYKRMTVAPLDRRRGRILFFLYSDTVEKNTVSGEFKRRVDFWPFYTFRRELNGDRRLQVLAPLEPFLPNNRSVPREYSPLWTLWQSERNAQTGAASQSLLWNLYRHEKTPNSKKISLLFGLFQYQSKPEGGSWRVCYLNVKTARAARPKS
jgi:hypothetical protein